jgi:hypothetical protein
MLRMPVLQHRDAPDFVQTGPLSHTFGQPFKPAPMRPMERIRSLWPFSVANDEAADSRSDDDAPPSSFVT